MDIAPPDAPHVVVEIAPPDTNEALRQALLDACTGAAQGAICVEGTPDHEDMADVVAIVSWRDRTSVRLEVALRREKEWVARDLGFSETDIETERWRTVGLVIGTLGSVLVNELRTESEAPPPEPPRAPPPDASTPDRHPPSPSPEPISDRKGPPRGFVNVGAVASSAFRSGLPRLGAALDGGVLVHAHDAYGLYATAGAAYAERLGRDDGVHATWLEGSLGVGLLRELGASFTGLVRADGFVERFHASVAAPPDASPSSASRIGGGVKLGADLAWWPRSRFGLFLGAAARWTAGSTEVRNDGESAGTTPKVGYVLRLGASYGFR